MCLEWHGKVIAPFHALLWSSWVNRRLLHTADKVQDFCCLHRTCFNDVIFLCSVSYAIKAINFILRFSNKKMRLFKTISFTNVKLFTRNLLMISSMLIFPRALKTVLCLIIKVFFSSTVTPRVNIGGTQYRNTVRKISKYRSTTKIDEIPMDSWRIRRKRQFKAINAVFRLLWEKIASKLSKALFATRKLSFLFVRGQINRLLVSGMHTKQNFEFLNEKKIEFRFLRSTPRSFSFLFHFFTSLLAFHWTLFK